MSALEFDVGSLIWVKPEIESAISKAREHIGQFATDLSDTGQLRYAQTYLHQISGALDLVGLEALTRIVQSAESLSEEAEQGRVSASVEIATALDQALQQLDRYLARLVDGGSYQPLQLYPAYRLLNEARGHEDYSPGDLFYPDLSARLPARLPTEQVSAQDRGNQYRLVRSRFQGALLGWLRQPNNKDLETIASCMVRLFKLQDNTSSKAFWWAAAAAGVGMLEDPESATQMRILLSKLDRQIRRLVDGQTKAPEILHRQLLHIAAKTKVSHPIVDMLCKTYKLHELIDLPSDSAFESENRLLASLRKRRDWIEQAKDIWTRITSGQTDRHDQLVPLLDKLANEAPALPHEALKQLLEELHRAIEKTDKPGERLSMDVATSLLLVEYALEQYPDIASDLEEQLRQMRVRLAASESDELPDLPVLDAVTREAQEKLVIAQVAHEIHNNLNQIEQVLDTFFRDRTQREQLASLAPQIHQITGALTMLGAEPGLEVLHACSARLSVLRQPDDTLSNDDMQFLAEALAALGFYTAALQNHEAEPERVLLPFLAAPPIQVTSVLQAEPVAATTALPSQPAPTVQTAPKADQVLDAAADEELLGIYLEEAREILSNLDGYLSACRDNAHDKASLTVIRRNFHTLKGSGRMVGLSNLGDVAWSVEQVLNKWLQEDWPTQIELLQFVTLAQEAFRRWVADLQRQGQANVDGSVIHELSQAFKNYPGTGDLPKVPATQGQDSTEERGKEASDGKSSVASQDPNEEGSPLGGTDDTLTHSTQHEAQLVSQTLDQIMVELDESIPVEPDGNSFLEILDAPAGAAELVSPPNDTGTAEDTPAALDLPPLFSDESPSEADQAADLDELSSNDLSEDQGTIQIGNVTISQSLFYIFSIEIQKRRQSLVEQLAACEVGEVLAPDLGHTAHTLRGIGYTTGFTALGELGHAFEHYLIGLRSHGVKLDADMLALCAQATDALAQMTQDIENQVEPQVDPDLIGRLVAATREDMDQDDDFSSQDIAIPHEETPETTGTILAFPGTPAASKDDVLDEETALAEHEGDVGMTLAWDDIPDLSLDDLGEAEITSMPAPPTTAMQASIGEPTFPTDEEEPHAAWQTQDELDEQLLPVFVEEAQELLPSIGESLRHWRQAPEDVTFLNQLQRDLHTLKGSARMVGAMLLGELTHQMESRVLAADGNQASDIAFFDNLDNDYDALLGLLDRLQAPPEAKPKDKKKTTGAASSAVVAPLPTANTPANTEATDDAKTTLRVRADIVDRLVNEAGEVSISRTRIEAEMRSLKLSMLELTDNVLRLRKQLRELEIQAETQIASRLSTIAEPTANFDPLEFDRFTRLQELTRLLAESVNDVATVQHTLLKNVDDAEVALLHQARLNRDLQQSLMRIRTIPLASLADRMYRIVRQTAKELGKKANLEIKGSRVEIDRSVLEKMTSPFEHMLRNAIDHGLEDKATRLARGKPEIGEITLEAHQEGNEVLITLHDDGGGIDPEKIRASALKKGLIEKGGVLSDQEALQLIFRPGFTTATKITQISGRGIGMEIVKSELEGLGGRIEVHSEIGVGSSFHIRLPLTLAVTQTVLVTANEQLYAIPSGLVQQVQEVKAGVLNKIYEAGKVEWSGTIYPFWYLPRLLGDAASRPDVTRYNTVMLLKSGESVVAIHVDKLMRNQEVVVKNIGPQLARVIGVAGATVLGTGEIVLIINPVQLGLHANEIILTGTYNPAEQVDAPEVQAAPIIMVVDDSLTVRKITGRLLERQGYQVIAAKDGMDALEQLQTHLPHIMLVDIEMPRMDGFELTRNVRNSPATKNIPIIMISSRTAEKHRKVAAELGVNMFLGKPFQEEELLEHVAGFLEAQGVALPS